MKFSASLLLVILSILFFTSFPDPLYAQRRGGSRPAVEPWAGRVEMPERSLPLVFDNRPFDTALEKLPPFYAGHEPGLLYDRMKSGKQDAGTESYAFRFTSVERVYNAGTGILTMQCPLMNVFDKGRADDAFRGFPVKYQPLVDNRYTTSGASGEKVEIEEIKFREWVLAFSNFMEYSPEKSLPGDIGQASDKDKTAGGTADNIDEDRAREAITGSIPLAQKEAKTAVGRTQVLLVFSPVPPYTSYDSIEERSTSGKLRDRLARYFYIHARLTEIWFYDFETGKILAKLRPRKAIRLGQDGAGEPRPPCFQHVLSRTCSQDVEPAM